METIVITFTNGDVITFTSCTGYARDATSVKFTGKKSGDSVSKTWEFNWASIRMLSRETA